MEFFTDGSVMDNLSGFPFFITDFQLKSVNDFPRFSCSFTSECLDILSALKIIESQIMISFLSSQIHNQLFS
jgi:hypothetical protein